MRTPTQAASATLTRVLATPTALPSPTSTPTPTPDPVVFDRSGYAQFAQLSQLYPYKLGERFEELFTPISHALSPSGELVAMGACWGSVSNTSRCETPDSGLLIVFNPYTAELVAEISLEGYWPAGLAFTADGSGLLYATTEQRVAVWDLQANGPGLTFYQEADVRGNRYPAAAAAPDGSSYAAVVNQALYVWNADGSLRFQAPAGSRSIGYATPAYSADASRLLIPAPDARVNVFDTASGTILGTIRAAFTDAHLAPDGRSVVTIDWETGDGQVWEVDSGSLVGAFSTPHSAESVQFNPADDLLVISGLGNLQTPDSYQYLATIIDTRSGAILGELFSFGDPGQVRINQDGSRVAFFRGAVPGVYGPADETLQSAVESVRLFQAALHTGDYAAAAAYFQPDEFNREYLAEQGFDFSDLPTSFTSLCVSQALACLPLLEAVMLGYDYEDIAILARLQAPDGSVFTTPGGGTLFFFYLAPSDPPVLITLPFD
jgi:hypothetical protein